jgi:hypothetical protein
VSARPILAWLGQSVILTGALWLLATNFGPDREGPAEAAEIATTVLCAVDASTCLIPVTPDASSFYAILQPAPAPTRLWVSPGTLDGGPTVDLLTFQAGEHVYLHTAPDGGGQCVSARADSSCVPVGLAVAALAADRAQP